MKNLNFLTLFLICLLISLGQLQRFEVSNGISFYLHDLVIGIWVTINLTIERLSVANLFRTIWAQHRWLILFVFALLVIGWFRALINGQELLAPPFIYRSLR